jgi:hypothetical protein
LLTAFTVNYIVHSDVLGIYMKVDKKNIQALDTLVDAHVFLGGNWVKTCKCLELFLSVSNDARSPKLITFLVVPTTFINAVDVSDRVGDGEIFIYNFPRVTLTYTEFTTQGLVPNIMYVVLVDDVTANVLDFNLLEFESIARVDDDENQIGGVEFLCTGSGTTIYLNGTIDIKDRVSFNGCIVDFRDGVLNLVESSSVIFQNSQLIGLDRCPGRYQVRYSDRM